jgi:uncharacterized protein YjbI with pentapeptide repeats
MTAKLTREDVLALVKDAQERQETADLSGQDLSGLDLSRGRLARVSLRGADLSGAKLRSANLNRADLRDAVLRNADLEWIAQSRRVTELNGANLTGADLRGANLHLADLSGATLGEADLTDANLHAADLQHADLRNTRLVNVDLRRAHLGRADLSGADLTGAQIDDETRLDRANLTNAKTDDPRIRARAALNRGMDLVEAGSVQGAVAAYSEAQALESDIEIAARDWAHLCWAGSLRGGAGEVLFACERAVELDPGHGGFRDSRGVARALTGNRDGAIEDFEAYIAWAPGQGRPEERIIRRRAWVQQLRAGHDPFDGDTLTALLQE